METECGSSPPSVFSSVQLQLNCLASFLCIIALYTLLGYQQTILQDHIQLFQTNFEWMFHQDHYNQYERFVDHAQSSLHCCGRTVFADYLGLWPVLNLSSHATRFIAVSFNKKLKSCQQRSATPFVPALYYLIRQFILPVSCCNHSSPMMCHHLDYWNRLRVYDDDDDTDRSPNKCPDGWNNFDSNKIIKQMNLVDHAISKGIHTRGCVDAAKEMITELGRNMEWLMIVRVGVESVVFLILRLITQSWESYYNWSYRPSVANLPVGWMVLLGLAWIGYLWWGMDF